MKGDRRSPERSGKGLWILPNETDIGEFELRGAISSCFKELYSSSSCLGFLVCFFKIFIFLREHRCRLLEGEERQTDSALSIEPDAGLYPMTPRS